MKLIGFLIGLALIISFWSSFFGDCANCISDCASGKTQQGLQQTLSGVELRVRDMDYTVESDGSVTNSFEFGFYNAGTQDIYDLSCDILLYDEQDEYIGTIEFEVFFKPVGIVGIDTYVEPGQSSTYYRQELVSVKGRIATSLKVENLRVNGEDKWFDFSYEKE